MTTDRRPANRMAHLPAPRGSRSLSFHNLFTDSLRGTTPCSIPMQRRRRRRSPPSDRRHRCCCNRFPSLTLADRCPPLPQSDVNHRHIMGLRRSLRYSTGPSRGGYRNRLEI